MVDFDVSNMLDLGPSSPLSSLPSSMPTSPAFASIMEPFLSPSSRRSARSVSPTLPIKLEYPPKTEKRANKRAPRKNNIAKQKTKSPLERHALDLQAALSEAALSDCKSSLHETSDEMTSQTQSSAASTTDLPSSSQQTRRRRAADSGPSTAAAAPKGRDVNHLDLTGDVPLEEQQQAVDALIKVLQKKKKIVVIAGAGISVSAGIPDFRSSTGLFKTLQAQYNLKSSGKDLFDISVYNQESSTTSFHHMVSEMSDQVKNAQPTPFHHMLATLAHEGRLLRLYTQNVDSLDSNMVPLATKVPLRAPWPKTIQLHGSLDKSVCVKCHALFDFDASIFSGPKPPSCSKCLDLDFTRTAVAGKRSHGVGHLRPRMVLYNEVGPDELSIGTVSGADIRARPDALIVVGTTLKVPGTRKLARELAASVQSRRDGLTIWINYDKEPSGNGLDKCWDLIVKGPCDKVAELAALRRWDAPPSPSPPPTLASHVDSEEMNSLNSAQSRLPRVRVVVPKDGEGELITPRSSPVAEEKCVQIEKKPKQKNIGTGTVKVTRKRVTKPTTTKTTTTGDTKISTAFQVTKSSKPLTSVPLQGKTIKEEGNSSDSSTRAGRRVSSLSRVEKSTATTRSGRARKSDVIIPGTSEFSLDDSSVTGSDDAVPLTQETFTSAFQSSTSITWTTPIGDHNIEDLAMLDDVSGVPA